MMIGPYWAGHQPLEDGLTDQRQASTDAATPFAKPAYTVIEGSGAADSLSGSEAPDHIFGFAGDDVLSGLGGTDWLEGGSGDDILAGGHGKDILDNGEGIDTASFAAAEQAQMIDLARGRAGGLGSIYVDRLISVEKVIGSAFGDAITGGVGGETLSGGAGDDLLNGGAGDDLLDGGEGLDTASYADATGGVTVDLRILLASGPAGTDALVSIENVVGSGFADILSGFQGANSLSGGDGADTLNGLGGDDILDGGAGDDRIFSGSGTDLLTGGGGVDTFLFTGLGFSTTAARDRITDLTGKDVIDLAGIDADSLTAGDQAFHQVAAFSGMAGELVLTYDASLVQTRLTADVNGDGLADFDLLVNGKHLNSAGWIL